ncbi:hypothetical protein JOE11_000471 [Robbsia andropogonis]
MSTKNGAVGAMSLLSEYLADPTLPCRQVRLQASPDGKTVLMVDIDQRKAGTLRTVCYEITPAELIAAIRAHGAELSQSSDEAVAAVEAMQRATHLGANGGMAAVGAAPAASAMPPSAGAQAPFSAAVTSTLGPTATAPATMPDTGTSFADASAISA